MTLDKSKTHWREAGRGVMGRANRLVAEFTGGWEEAARTRAISHVTDLPGIDVTHSLSRILFMFSNIYNVTECFSASREVKLRFHKQNLFFI